MKKAALLKKKLVVAVPIAIVIGVLLVGSLAYALVGGAVRAIKTNKLEGEILALQNERDEQAEALTEAEETIEKLEEDLEEYEEDTEDLERDLKKAEKKYEEIEDSVGEALGTVEFLNKKSKVDPQLLQKYSKVYFLNEHYSPETVDAVPKEYTFGKEVLINGKIISFVEDLFEDAEDDGIDLRAISGFRSFGEQESLKYRYVVTYGAGTANQFSADQGYSEHQLGTTLDFSTQELGGIFENFGETEAFEWMEDNAYKYGFVLSYPEGNEFYQYEPWHWRFVGKDFAKYLDRKDMYFYDADQRKIDEYTADFFDR